MLLFTRHARTVANNRKICIGRFRGCPLELEQLIDIESYDSIIAKLQFEFKFKYIVTSTLTRSVETGVHLYSMFYNDYISINSFAEFDEIDLGICKLYTYDQMAEFKRINKEAMSWNYSFPHGESYYMLEERVKRGLERLYKDYSDRDTIIITHNSVLKVINKLVNEPDTQKARMVEFSVGDIVVVNPYDIKL